MKNREILKSPKIKDFPRSAISPYGEHVTGPYKGVTLSDFDIVTWLSKGELTLLAHIIKVIKESKGLTVGHQVCQGFAITIRNDEIPDKGKNYVYNGLAGLLAKGIIARTYAKDVYWLNTNLIAI